MARFDQPIEPMTLGNMRASSGCGRSTFRAGIASTGLCSAPIAGLMRSQYRRSDRGWCAPAAGSSVLMPDRTGDGFTVRQGMPPWCGSAPASTVGKRRCFG
jgi:hypothetical protein